MFDIGDMVDTGDMVDKQVTWLINLLHVSLWPSVREEFTANTLAVIFIIRFNHQRHYTVLKGSVVKLVWYLEEIFSCSESLYSASSRNETKNVAILTFQQRIRNVNYP